MCGVNYADPFKSEQNMLQTVTAFNDIIFVLAQNEGWVVITREGMYVAGSSVSGSLGAGN